MMVRVLLEPPKPFSADPLRWFRHALLAIATAALGYTGYIYVDSALYQAREDRALDEPVIEAVQSSTATKSRSGVILEQALIGRIEIPRLNVRAVVKEGVDSKTLRRAVGHVPGTALPGEIGNVAFAAHRDTFFRGLRDVRKDDRITVETFDREFQYVVDSTQIVNPKDVQVLRPTQEAVLTLVTCYPFNYVGNAPKRFIVRARQVSSNIRETPGS